MIFNTCKLKIKFNFVELNNQTMSINISTNNDTVQDLIQNHSGSYLYVKELILPTTVRLEFFGKNLNCDTIIDQTGQIIKDKCVIVESIALDNIKISKNALSRCIKLKNDSQEVVSAYVGFNGTVLLELKKSNVLLQIAAFERTL
jgi:hypothetical protein